MRILSILPTMTTLTLASRMPRFFCCALLLGCALLISGCGTYYKVSVDSLRESQLPAQAQANSQIPTHARAQAYRLVPGNPDTTDDDLLFREVCRMLGPAFAAQGFRVITGNDVATAVADNGPTSAATHASPRATGKTAKAVMSTAPTAAAGTLSTSSYNTARISYWEDAPVTTLETGVIRRSVPVVVGYGRHRRRGYVTVEEPTVTTHVVYSAGLLIAAYAPVKPGEEKQIWRTQVNASGPKGDLRTLILTMIPALELTLGTRTEHGKIFEVFVDDKGNMSIKALD